MNRSTASRQHALAAAQQLIDSIDLTEEEARVILGIALDRYQSVSRSLHGLGLSRRCISAVFAAALEYSETIAESDS